MDAFSQNFGSLSPPAGWSCTRSHLVTVNRHRGGLARRGMPRVDAPVRRHRRAPRRRQSSLFNAFTPQESLSPPRIFKIPLRILPGRYGNLRPPWEERRVETVRPVTALDEYVYKTRMIELTPSPPRSAVDGRRSSRGTTLPRRPDWRARPWRLPAAPVTEAPAVETPPPPSPPPPPIAVEEDGLLQSQACRLGAPFYYRHGDPIYFPFHPSTEEWAEVEAAVDLEMAQPGFPGRSPQSCD